MEILHCEVYRHGNLVTRLQPCAALAERRVENPAGQRLNGPGLLGQWNELGGQDAAAVGVGPAREGLDSGDLPIECHFWLERERELIVFDCPPQLANQRQTLP